MALLTARVTVRGRKPLLFHSFGPDAIPLEKQERTGVAGNDPWEWQKSVSADADGRLYLDSSYAFACIRDGARYVKKGRGSIQAMVVATLEVLEDVIYIDRSLPLGADALLPENYDKLSRDRTEPVYLDVRSVVNPSTKGRNVRYRVAASPGWEASFGIMWDGTVVGRHEMQSAVIEAGKLCGFGSGRKIGMGRFTVEEFTVGGAE